MDMGCRTGKSFPGVKEIAEISRRFGTFRSCKRYAVIMRSFCIWSSSHTITQNERRSDRPIAFASRTLTAAEKNYSVLERESLAITFGVRNFQLYLYGNFVTIITDHKPLVGLYREYKTIPAMAASRIQRWTLTLSGYDDKIVYREGKGNNADALSRLPISENTEVKNSIPADTIMTIEHLEANTPVTSKQIKKWTSKDKILSKVLRYVLHGWSGECTSDEIKPFLTVNMKSVARWNTSMGRTSDYTRNCKGNHVN
jgi:hypothetical protein